MGIEKIKEYVLVGLITLTSSLLLTIVLPKQLFNNPTLPTKQLIDITFTTNALYTKNPFLNLILNFRLFEIMFTAIITALLTLKTIIVKTLKTIYVTTSLVLLSTIIVSDVFTNNPLHTFTNQLFGLLEVAFVFSLTIFMLTLLYVQRSQYIAYIVKKNKINLLLSMISISLVLNWRFLLQIPELTIIYIYLLITPILAEIIRGRK
ncbi:MAG: hypothetical protein B6U89_00685 [Desulfurococcales archaeon ex4484_58]|nr:MAG: hypothetical protein B6U89_00685 [Desulfurococcales archaeon ex4484_58]